MKEVIVELNFEIWQIRGISFRSNGVRKGKMEAVFRIHWIGKRVN